LGNPMAASGPMQIAAALLSMRHSTIPPTANLHCPDPLCDLDYVPLRPRRGLINVAMVDSHGFDNVDVTVLLAKGRGERSC
jgi:act minimal PKS ketosynthase (KS/KS alpha)